MSMSGFKVECFECNFCPYHEQGAQHCPSWQELNRKPQLLPDPPAEVFIDLD